MPYIEYARGKAKRKILPKVRICTVRSNGGAKSIFVRRLYGEEQGAGEQGE